MSEQTVIGWLPGGIDHYSHCEGGEEHKPEERADHRSPAAALTHLQPRQTGQVVGSLG